MKKYISISLFVFWLVVIILVLGGLIFSRSLFTLQTSGPVASSSVLVDPNVVLNRVEVAKHNYAGDCWLLISNKVYNVTSYLNEHPGRANTIIPTCGTDATTAYNTKGGEGGDHSGGARRLLQNYYLGDLVE